MRRLLALPLTRNTNLFLAVIVGVLAGIMFLGSGHAAADCGIGTNQLHDYAGLTVTSAWVGDDGNTNISNNNTVTVSEHGGGASDSIGGNIVVMSKVAENEVPGSRFTSVTFSQIGGCGSSMVVLPGDGSNGSPQVGSGISDWGLDCDNSKLGTDGSGNPLFQQFDVTGNGVPNGARAGGSWNVATTASSGANAAANGQTLHVTIWYTQPPQTGHNPIPPQPVPPTTGLSCSGITYDSGVGVDGTHSYPIQAQIYLSGASLYGGNFFQVNNNSPMTGDHSSNILPSSQSIVMSAVEFWGPDTHGHLHYVVGSAGNPAVIATAGSCFSSSCNMTIDSGLPDNDVVPGRPFTVYATIFNDSAPYTNTSIPIPIPNQLDGGTVAFQSSDGGFSNFNYATQNTGGPGFAVGSGGPISISFQTAVNGGGTMSGQLASVDHYFIGSGCSAPINLYQAPAISAGVACQSSVYGVAYDPYIPGFPIYVDVYADGPAGGGGTFIGEVQSSGPGNSYSLAMPAAYQDGQNHTFYAYGIDPYGIENGGPATIGMTGCEEFHVAPGANGAHLMPTVEDPTSFGNTGNDTNVTVTYNGNSYYGPNTSFSPSFPGVPVSAAYIYTKNGAGASSGVIPSPTGTGRFIDQNYLPPPLPVTVLSTSAGDRYCLYTNVNISDGFIQNDGTVLTSSTNPNPDNSTPSCDTVQNRPFFKTYNGALSAGGAFSSAGGVCPANSGELASWNNDSGTQPNYGASTQLSAVATGDTVGFATNQSVFNNPSTKLSLANTVHITGNGTDGSEYSPNLGGDFGGCPTLTSETPPAGSSSVAGPYTLPATVISPGASQSQSIFVNGDVYITGNILYKGDNSLTGSGASWTSTADIPSFVLHASGNIYIAPGVTELDGLYIAEPSGGSGGTIYTCGPGAGAMTAAFIANAYTACKNQLTVYGNFVANRVSMMRTYGSLRDETPTPGTPATSGSPAVPGADGPLIWNHAGGVNDGGQGGDNATNGDTCTQINEPWDPNTWDDNYLCVPATSSIKLAWSYAGSASSTTTPDCTVSWGSVVDPYGVPSTGGEATNRGWNDNYLCSNYPVSFQIGNPDPTSKNEYCTLVNEPADADGTASPFSSSNSVWQNTYVCISKPVAAVSATAATAGAPPSPLVCSNSIGAIRSSARPTCAAEVFDFVPEIYLSTPAVAPASGGTTQYDAITSLPPVL